MSFREAIRLHGRAQYLARVFDGVFWMKPGLADLMRQCAAVFEPVAMEVIDEVRP